MRIIWSASAEADLDRLIRYVAEHDLKAALALDNRIWGLVGKLASYPLMGRPGRCEDWRELVVSSTAYIVMYRVVEGRVEILRILHGAQSWPPETSE